MTTTYSKESEKKQNAYMAGATIKKAYGTITSGDTIAVDDIFVLAQGLGPNAIIHSVKISNTACTGLSNNDIVLRRNGSLGKIDTDEISIASGISLATANVAPKELLGENITNFDRTKTLAEIANKRNDALGGAVDLCLKANAAASASVTLKYEIEYSSP